jgi:hypothetical protein
MNSGTAKEYESKYVLDGTKRLHDPGNRLKVGMRNNNVIELGEANAQ